MHLRAVLHRIRTFEVKLVYQQIYYNKSCYDNKVA